MTKRMAIWMAVTMSSLFLFLALASRSSEGIEQTVFGSLAALSLVLLLCGTIGALIVGVILDVWVRRHGTRVIGTLIHAKPAGYVNTLPNYELEYQLEDGRTARMQMTTSGGVFPGTRRLLIVNGGNPARAVLPPEDTSRPEF